MHSTDKKRIPLIIICFFIIIFHSNIFQEDKLPKGNIQSIVEYRMDSANVLIETITREYLKDGKSIFYQSEKLNEEAQFVKNKFTKSGYLSTQETNESTAVYEYVNDSILAKISYFQSYKLTSFKVIEFNYLTATETRVLIDFNGTLLKRTFIFFDKNNELLRREIVSYNEGEIDCEIIQFYENGLEQKRSREFYKTTHKNREIDFEYNKNDKLIKQIVKGGNPHEIRKKYNVQGDLIKEKRYEFIEGKKSLISKITYVYEYDFNNHWIKMTEYKDGDIIGKRTRTISYFQ